MIEPVPDRSSEVDDRTPSPAPGALLALAIVFVLALVLGATRFLGGPSGITSRENGVEEIERAWAARKVDAGSVVAIRRDAARAKEWHEQLERPVGVRSWRFGHRGVTPTKPPDSPKNLKAGLNAAGDAIVLEWDPAEDADEIVVLRSMRVGEGATKVEGLFGAADTWQDKIRALSGAYTYSLRSVRNGVESRGTSDAVTVEFEIPFRMEVLSLDRDAGVAWIHVGPRPDGPRPQFFAGERFRVKVNEIVGTQAQWFDYATGYAFRSIFEVELPVREVGNVPVFTPEGARARDAGGKPLFKRASEEREIVQVRILLKKDDAPDIRLDVPR